MEQEIFNWVVAGAGFLIGWVLKTVWGSVKDLQKSDKEIIDRVASVEILVAGKYTTRDELERIVDRLFKKLDGISEKLNTKADK